MKELGSRLYVQDVYVQDVLRPPPPLGDRLGPKPGQFAEEKRKLANMFSFALGSVAAASIGHFANPMCDRLISMEKGLDNIKRETLKRSEINHSYTFCTTNAMRTALKYGFCIRPAARGNRTAADKYLTSNLADRTECPVRSYDICQDVSAQ